MATATASKTTIRPIDDRIVVRANNAEEKTKSGIYLPEGAKEKPSIGKIVAAGNGKLNDDGSRTPLSVKVGDTVVYGKYSGTEVEIDGEKLLIIRENELLGIIE